MLLVSDIPVKRPEISVKSKPSDRMDGGPTDLDLMTELSDRRDSALRVIVQRYGSAVVGLSTRILGDEALANDVTQEVFMRLWQKPERFHAKRGSLKTFLLVQAHSLSVDAIRSRGARQRREDRVWSEDRSPAPMVDTDVLAREEAREVRAAYGQLPPAERRSIELAYFGGFTYREVAKILELPEGTVKTHIRNGLRRMKVTLSAQPV